MLIAHQDCLVLDHSQVDHNIWATITEFKWVAQEVYYYLKEATFISVNFFIVCCFLLRERRVHKRHIFLTGNVSYDVERVFNSVQDREIAFVEFKSIVFHLGEIEKIHHQVSHYFRTEKHHFDRIYIFTQLLIDWKNLRTLSDVFALDSYNILPLNYNSFLSRLPCCINLLKVIQIR